MSDAPAAENADRVNQLIETATACASAEQRAALLAEGLLNFGAEFVTAVNAARARERERYEQLHGEMFTLCREWLEDKRLSVRADEDARKARFALWFCTLIPGLARVAARIVFQLPDGHPDRDVNAVRTLLMRQFQLAVERRIDVGLAPNAIAGLLQLELLEEERALALIAAGQRIIDREGLRSANDNFRVIAVPSLHLFRNKAERSGETDSVEWLQAEADRMVASLDAIAEPARDVVLLKSLLTRGDYEKRSELQRKLLPQDGVGDDISLYAARLKAGDLYALGKYREAISLLEPLLPTFEEHYLTAVESHAVEKSGEALSEVLLRMAFSHANLDDWAEALRLLDRTKSLRLRYESMLRRLPGTERVLELQAGLLGLERGLSPAALPSVDAGADPVGAKLSARSLLVEAYREQRAALRAGELAEVRIAQLSQWLDHDCAALIFGESDDGLLVSIVTGDDIDKPYAASLVPRRVIHSIVERFVDARNGWLVALALPEFAKDPSEALGKLLETLDRIVGQPVADVLRDAGVTRLVVVPHGFLHPVPFWALPSFANLDVMIAPSAQHVAALRADPVYVKEYASVVGNPTLDLPTAEVEAALVSERLRSAGFNVELLSRDNATESALEESVARAAMLHFAGHGRSDIMRPLQSALELYPDCEPDVGEMLVTLSKTAAFGPLKDNQRHADLPKCGRLFERVFPATGRTELRLEHSERGTLLAQCAESLNGEPKLLRLSELWTASDLVTSQSLRNCGLMFLSSCQVGQGGLSTSFDEHAGLPAALELAGVRTLICPLWRVEDVTSAVFAGLFYEEVLSINGEVDLAALVSRVRRALRTMSGREAAQRVRELAARAEGASTRFMLEARAHRIEVNGVPPFADPLDWAAFQVLGVTRIVVGPANSHQAPSPRQSVCQTVDHGTKHERAVRPILIVEPETPTQPVANARGDVTDAYVTLAKASQNGDLIREAVSRLHERAQRQLKRRHFEEARGDFNCMVELDAKSAEAYAGLGRLALAENDLEGAMVWLDRAIALNPKLAPAYRDRGMAWFARMDPRRAIADYTSALNQSTDHEVLALRGTAWIAAGNPLEALADSIKAIQNKPDAPSGYLGKALAFAALRRFEAAIEACNLAIERRPEDGALYVQRTMYHAALNALDEAIGDCDTAILLLPDPAPAYAQKGYFLAAAGEIDAALAEYRRAIEANPNFGQTYLSRACALSLNKTEGTIVEDLKRVITASPEMRQIALLSPELEWARNNIPEVHPLLGG